MVTGVGRHEAVRNLGSLAFATKARQSFVHEQVTKEYVKQMINFTVTTLGQKLFIRARFYFAESNIRTALESSITRGAGSTGAARVLLP